VRCTKVPGKQTRFGFVTTPPSALLDRDYTVPSQALENLNFLSQQLLYRFIACAISGY